MSKEEFWMISDEGTESKIISESEVNSIIDEATHLTRSLTFDERHSLEASILRSTEEAEDLEDADVLAVKLDGVWLVVPEAFR